MIAQLDKAIDPHWHKLPAPSELPPLVPKPRQRGRKPHDPGFDVRTALYYGPASIGRRSKGSTNCTR